jgi:predicted RNA-binding Zn-ribbon protein involved in translation (DUF1610 family)
MSNQMLLLKVCCPNCDAVLTEGQKVHLDAYVKDTNQNATIYLSAAFGDYTVECDVKIPAGAIVEFRCPACDESIMLQIPCRLCGAPMASLNIVNGGSVEFCSRRGCKGHALGGFGDVDQMMAFVNSMFNTPHD